MEQLMSLIPGGVSLWVDGQGNFLSTATKGMEQTKGLSVPDHILGKVFSTSVFILHFLGCRYIMLQVRKSSLLQKKQKVKYCTEQFHSSKGDLKCQKLLWIAKFFDCMTQSFWCLLFLVLSKKLFFKDRFPSSLLSLAPLEGCAIILLAVDMTIKLRTVKPSNMQPLGNLGSTIWGHPWMLLGCHFSVH